ncbi:hypothetical protein F3Y22_tig00110580pilonHSYRG00195 [Hibiscus syriacus]|uniref:RRM domain-containing protein n=1 Tax=Hibiscus syriacus TaxID=106335 RepID=A0A6A3A592_HIBSY|nr:hypothetical protein F3Y22_tig00110580pilonHSYRG00195 [Hibiscus syriacus]
MQRHEGGSSFQSDFVSLFVDNLPNSIHWKGLWQIVGRFGEVLSVYLPLRRSRAGSRFGFVKVGNMVEASRVKERLNGLMVFGSRISVSFAKYSLKRPKDKCAQCKLSWKGNIANPFATSISQSKEGSLAWSTRKEVKGHVDEDEVRKLKRCLVGVMAGVCSVGSIVDRLHNWGLGEIKVQRLRGNSFLLTIEDEDLFIMLEDLQWSYLKEIFVDVMLWTESFYQKERVVWLEIEGLPLHCWNAVTLKRLFGLWGRFEAFGDNVSHLLDCEKVNMLISTSSEVRINEVVDVVVENKKFDVLVLEVRMVDHSLGNLSKFEILKKVEVEVEKYGVVVGASNAGGSPVIHNLKVASESGSSDGKEGSPSVGIPLDVVCSGDCLCCRKEVSFGKQIEVEGGVDDGGQNDGFQNLDQCNHVGLQGLDIDGVETLVVDSNEVSPIIGEISKLEDRVLVNASNVVSPEIEPPCRIGLKSGFLLKSFKDDLVNSGGRSEGLVLGSVNSSELGDINKWKISGKECVGGVVEDVSCVPELSIRNKKKMHKFGSMLDIQDSVLLKAERCRRDRALKSSKLKKSDLEFSELSGRSISDSDIKKKWGAAFVEAEETLSVAKMLGITFAGPERKVLEELVSLEMC